MSSSTPWSVVRCFGDAVAVTSAWYGATLLRTEIHLPWTRDLLPSDRLSLVHAHAAAVLIGQLILLYLFGLYDGLEPVPRLLLVRRLLFAASMLGLLLTGYFFLGNLVFPRSVVVLFVPIAFLLLLGWRLLVQQLHQPRRRRVVLVGSGPEAVEVATNIGRHHWHGLEVAGYLEPPGSTSSADPPPACLGERLGGIEDLPRLLEELRFDDVILATSARSWQSRLLDRLAGVRPNRQASLLMLPGPFESLIGRMRYRWVHDIPLIEVMRASEWRIQHPVKRLLDLVIGSLLLVPGLPVMAACALAVRVSSQGPILYRQTRVGRGQRPFVLYKFRTMRDDAETEGGEVLATPGDPRSTAVGALLRRTRLDELPQLFNVLGGTMSLVGPRPERPGFVRRYLAEVPGYAERFSLRPGLTGLAQISGDYHSTPENKLRYDLAYMANWSVWLDLSILFRTVKTVLTSQGV